MLEVNRRSIITRPEIEIIQPEPIQSGKATPADKAIEWMCDSWQKNKPGNFFDRKNTIFTDVVESVGTPESKNILEEKEVKEQDLEVVHEVLNSFEKMKQEGNLVSQEKNPLGENIKDVTMLIFGDTHIPGGNLEEEVYEKNQPYIFLKKVRALFTGVKREIKKEVLKEKEKENEPIEYLAIKKAIINLATRLKESYQILKSGKDKEVEEKIDSIREDLRKDDGVDSFNAFLALKKSFSKYLVGERENLDDESHILAMHVGDNISNEQKIGDVIYSAAQLEEMRSELASYSNKKTVLAIAQGNHDSDLINYGLEHDGFNRELFGSQVFLQEVGDDAVILSLNTNLYSTFWHEHLERRKSALQERVDQVTELKESDGDVKEIEVLEKINQIETMVLGLVRQEMNIQKKLVQEAKDSGKKIILVGHEKGYLKQAIGGSFKKERVISVISGHDHKHKHSKGKNSEGEDIDFLNVGKNKKVGDGIDKKDIDPSKINDNKEVDDYVKNKSVLSGYALRVKEIEGNTQVTVEEIIPTEADYQEAVYMM